MPYLMVFAVVVNLFHYNAHRHDRYISTTLRDGTIIYMKVKPLRHGIKKAVPETGETQTGWVEQ